MIISQMMSRSDIDRGTPATIPRNTPNMGMIS
jgi:hypothetical protein